MFEELVRKNRSCRRFYQNQVPDVKALKKLINLARLSHSGANLQPLKYVVSNNQELNEQIFDCLAWAAYLEGWPGPASGERPAAYIVVLGDTTIARKFEYDAGIAVQSMLLGARNMGLAGCIINSIQRKKLTEILSIPQRYLTLLVLALGKPRENVTIETMGPEDDVKYWRDDQGVHHVPKRSLNDIILNCHK